MNRNSEQISKYYITNSTYCLISQPNSDKVFTVILDKHGKTTMSFPPLRVIRHTCTLNGSTFEATTQQAREFLGHNRHKVPIMVAYNFGDPCVVFPLFSPHSKQNIWVTVNAIINIEEMNESTLVTFVDGTEQIFPVHLKSFNQQYVRAVLYYKNLILQRKALI
ncbi:competence protein ComK [Solibacillus sp. MA9]|uniref:Competence protein ComK n=1 Tax=Solibacillus palustris TaxID=2908203 RepID=A0ABS9U8V8_9BACL|nr:competence protein ComK [Solibacillus sp. MA9]MCH7320668.1 competence protein ComK [Solibacillus sp. MA9]